SNRVWSSDVCSSDLTYTKRNHIQHGSEVHSCLVCSNGVCIIDTHKERNCSKNARFKKDCKPDANTDFKLFPLLLENRFSPLKKDLIRTKRMECVYNTNKYKPYNPVRNGGRYSGANSTESGNTKLSKNKDVIE